MENFKITSLPGNLNAVNGTVLPAGTWLSESRKRLPCKGNCGFVFPDNRERFWVYRGRRFCFACAAAGKVA